MLLHLRRAIVCSLIFIALCGVAYPLAGTGLSQLFLSHQANGSLTANGSVLIGQQWKGAGWFHGRPSATVDSSGKPAPYDAMASGASNLGPRSEQLLHNVERRAAALREGGITPTNGLVTSSGSGLDPDISPADAYAQVASVAAARHLSPSAVHQLVAAHVEGKELGFLGAPYVDVLELNVALAAMR